MVSGNQLTVSFPSLLLKSSSKFNSMFDTEPLKILHETLNFPHNHTWKVLSPLLPRGLEWLFWSFAAFFLGLPFSTHSKLLPHFPTHQQPSSELFPLRKVSTPLWPLEIELILQVQFSKLRHLKNKENPFSISSFSAINLIISARWHPLKPCHSPRGPIQCACSTVCLSFICFCIWAYDRSKIVTNF